MKKFSFLLSMFALIFAVVLVSSCKKDDPDPDPVDHTPVLGTDFTFTVNENTVNFTTTLSGNVWVKNINSGVTTNFTDGACSVFIPLAADYPFTCNVLVDGVEYASAEFNVKIDNDDVSYLNEGLWKHLSGGAGNTKTWRMDMNSDGVCVYFDGPLYYSGAENDPYWAWDVYELPYDLNGTLMETYFNWSPSYPDNTWIMAAQDYGTITFSGNDLIAVTNKFGVEETGSFTFDTTTMKLDLTTVTLPTDTSRINEGQVVEWGKIRVFSLTDSSMQLGLKRVYEGFNDDGSQKESKWTLVYNFVCNDYDYPMPEQFTYEETVNTSFTKDDLVGTWKYGEVPMGWIAWEKNGDQGTHFPAHLYEKWYTTADVVTTLSSWGATFADSLFTANSTKEYVFNADGSCSLNGEDNTFTVTDGVISFGNALTGDEFNGVWINLVGDLKVIEFDKMGPETDLVNTPPFPGIWIGEQNDGKTEYRAVHLEKIN
jgi:hypothetical protein